MLLSVMVNFEVSPIPEKKATESVATVVSQTGAVGTASTTVPEITITAEAY